MSKRDKTETITLGSGHLYCTEYSGTIPTRESICVDANLLGRISGGASLEYTPSYYTAQDDFGKVKKTIITEEDAKIKSGIITWNGETLKKLCRTARVTEANGIRTVKIGGAANDDGKEYVVCFHHHDAEDGDVWVTIRGVNTGSLVLAFAKEKETTIDAEITALPQDSDGTLILYEEEMTAAAANNPQ